MKKIIFTLVFLFLTLLVEGSYASKIHADSITDAAINYLKRQQDSNTGGITGGFGATSEWAAIAFEANGNHILNIQSSATSSSLLQFLLNDKPSSPSADTDWESRILSIVDANYNPDNFNGINYVDNLENFSTTQGYLGNYCTFNGDLFGLIALISADRYNDSTTKNLLNFIISKQDSSGGFSFLTDNSCSTSNYPYSVSADITGVAAVALAHAKSSGMTADGLNNAIASVSSYLTNPTNIDSDGGYGYYGSSDTDTTGWVLQGLNALGLGDSQQAQGAKTYLTKSPQLGNDGGITECNSWDPNGNCNGYASNPVTTSQAVIGLLGKDWILNIYDPSKTNPDPVLSPTVIPTDTSSPTPTPDLPNSSSSSPTSTPTPTMTAVPTFTPTPTVSRGGNVLASNSNVSPTNIPTTSPSQSPKEEVLGVQTQTGSSFQTILAFLFIGLGVIILGVYVFLNLSKFK